MQRAAAIIRRMDAGDRITVVNDGQSDHIELRRPWLPIKTVITVSATERALVEVAMLARSRRASATTTAR